MNDDNKLMKMQEDDLVIVELDSRYDMSIIDPLAFADPVQIIIQQSGCTNNCVAGC